MNKFKPLYALVPALALTLGGAVATANPQLSAALVELATHQPAITTENGSTVTPADPDKLNLPAPSADAPETPPTEDADTNVSINPAPAPKPATIYSDHPSAATPCRLQHQNIYTNDCSAPVPQPTPTPTPEPSQPAPPGPCAVCVPNEN